MSNGWSPDEPPAQASKNKPSRGAN